MKVETIDHFVLTVRDVEATCRFYERVLGMEVVTFGEGRRALRPTPGSADFCLITGRSLVEVIAHLHACGVDVVEGPVPRAGALGPIESVYIRDPDGNLVEIANALPG